MARRTVYSSSTRRRRLAALVGIAAIAAAVAAVVAGGSRDAPASRKAPQPFTVGSGARSAFVLPARGPRRRATVVFLHGWGLSGRRAYRPWLRHLAARGSTVIVPRYQTGLETPPEAVPGNAIAGIRSALRRLGARPRGVVVVGHSVGGVLAVDYAARAGALGLPPALAVMSVFPGAALRGRPPIPEDDPAQLPGTVRRLVVLTSPTDEIVGKGPGEQIYSRAVGIPPQRRRLVSVDDPAAGDHFAPATDSPAARRAFWRRLDRLLLTAA